MPNLTYLIIVTYNGMPWLRECLDSCKNYQVIVVDNASSDNTVCTIQNEFPQIILIQMTENLGFGQANNFGIQYALKQGAEHVFLLNQDAYIIDSCLEQLIRLQKQNSEYGILSPLHLDNSASKLEKNFFKYILKAEKENYFSNLVLNQPIETIYELPFVNAAAWLISRECLEKVGGFDPIFFHYGEDANYCHRLTYHNFKIGFTPSARVIHDRIHSDKKKIIEGTVKYFEKFERHVKLDLANINHSIFDKKFDHKMKYCKSQIIKAMFFFNGAALKEFRKKYSILKSCYEDIERSRSLNSDSTMTFLYLNEKISNNSSKN